MKSLFLTRHGLSLVEILVVIAALELLATIIVPNTAGFLRGGKEKAYQAEKETLQVSVDGWRNTVSRTAGPLYPILQCGVAGPA